MFTPKKAKYRKWQKMRKHPRRLLSTTKGIEISFGKYGLKAMSTARVTSNQIEASRRVISRSTSKLGKLWIRIFPNRPYTKKAAEVGMGKGKGEVEGYHTEILPGKVLFELDNVTEEDARVALVKAGKKLPLKTKFIIR